MSAPGKRNSGLSYLEVLIAVMLIALALSPMIESLTTGMTAARIQLSRAEENAHLTSILEDVLAKPFGALDSEAIAVGNPALPTSYSDAAGSSRRRLVYLSRYDGDDADGDGNPLTGGDDGLLWVRVELENTHQALETLTAR